MTAQSIALLGADAAASTALAEALVAYWRGQGLAPSQTPALAVCNFPEDLARLSGCTHALLMALDPRADSVQEAADAALRAALQRRGIAFSVLHGRSGAERLANALYAMAEGANKGRSDAQTRWRGPCEKCADPACEHRLFRDLLAARA